MYLCSIETSCDETSLAIFKSRKLIYHQTYSQVSFHKKYHGVVPEIASRLHSEKISSLIKDANIKKLEYVSFTRGPGLKGSLLVGKIAALTIAKYFNAKVIGINHLEGHLFACDIVNEQIKDILRFPLLGLIVSGGHTELWYCKDYGKYKRIGSTRDDACGEAFDKVARMLTLEYPGGPQIEKYALKAKKFNINFTVPDVENSYDYSFSGIKTQVMYYLRNSKKITEEIKCEVAFGFQKAVCESLVRKLKKAQKDFNVKNIAVCGGVSANNYLRELVMKELSDCKIYFPDKKYTSDNAAMIGVVAFRKIQKGRFRNSIEINDSLKIGDWT